MNNTSVKIYHGYGHTHNLVVYGHVYKFKAKTAQNFSNNLFVNILYLFKLFVVKPFPFTKVKLNFYGQIIEQKTEFDGFFKFEWKAENEVEAGWHSVKVYAFNEKDEVVAKLMEKYMFHILHNMHSFLILMIRLWYLIQQRFIKDCANYLSKIQGLEKHLLVFKNTINY